MIVDSRFVDLCFTEVRLHTLLDQKRFLDRCISECQSEISQIQSDIAKYSNLDKID